jgi:hypothetical protein
MMTRSVGKTRIRQNTARKLKDSTVLARTEKKNQRKLEKANKKDERTKKAAEKAAMKLAEGTRISTQKATIKITPPRNREFIPTEGMKEF